MSGISRRQVLIAGALFAGAAAIGARGAAQAGWFGLGSDGLDDVIMQNATVGRGGFSQLYQVKPHKVVPFTDSNTPLCRVVAVPLAGGGKVLHGLCCRSSDKSVVIVWKPR